MKQLLHRVWSDGTGEDLAEYALIVLLIAVALVAAVETFTPGISVAFSEGISALAQ